MPGNSVRHAQKEAEQVRAYSVAPTPGQASKRPPLNRGGVNQRSDTVQPQLNFNQLLTYLELIRPQLSVSGVWMRMGNTVHRKLILDSGPSLDWSSPVRNKKTENSLLLSHKLGSSTLDGEIIPYMDILYRFWREKLSNKQLRWWVTETQ